MNEKFYQLPYEKQQKIIDAGYRIFSQNSYEKSPMKEIADAAGISKSLLFHYFRNKKELYLFLWEEAARITTEYLMIYECYEASDLFVMMERGMKAKWKLMEKYPHMAAFAIKAFYEKNEEINTAVQNSYRKHFDQKAKEALKKLDPDDFIEGLDLQMMKREMHLASEGYLWEMLQLKKLNTAQMEKDFHKLLQFWKHVYSRKEDIQ